MHEGSPSGRIKSNACHPDLIRYDLLRPTIKLTKMAIKMYHAHRAPPLRRRSQRTQRRRMIAAQREYPGRRVTGRRRLASRNDLHVSHVRLTIRLDKTQRWHRVRREATCVVKSQQARGNFLRAERASERPTRACVSPSRQSIGT